MNTIVLSKHASQQLINRKISEEVVWKILSENDEYAIEDGLSVFQGLVVENNRNYLIRIFINKNVNPCLVVTVYKTSKIKKYL